MNLVFGFPQFKARKFSKLAYRTPYNGGNAKVYSKETVKLPKVGIVATKPIHLPKEYCLLSITISKTKSGKCFASLAIETIIQPLPKTGKKAGFDLGLAELFVSSDGSRVDPPKFMAKSRNKLAKAQRKLSKMRTKLKEADVDLETAKNHQKQKRLVAKLHEHISNQRRDFNHKLSWKLVNTYDFLAFEDLNIQGMMRNHKLAYSIQDVSWYQLISFIKYKAEWYGKEFVQVDRFFASSKTCSECGCVHRDIVKDLSVREWVCPDCGTHHDRDLNAVINILNMTLSGA